MQLFLQHKPYRVLTLSILLGIFGTTLFDLVSVLYAATFPNPELAVGLASLITSLPYVFDFIVGYVSDRASNSFKAMKLVRMNGKVVGVRFRNVGKIYYFNS